MYYFNGFYKYLSAAERCWFPAFSLRFHRQLIPGKPDGLYDWISGGIFPLVPWREKCYNLAVSRTRLKERGILYVLYHDP